MNFEVGDEIVYNPFIANLPKAELRVRDWGFIDKISNGYIHMKFYSHDGPPMAILPLAITHSPCSPKYIRNIYALVLKSIHDEAINKKIRKYKNTYTYVLEDLIKRSFERHIKG